MCMVIAVLFLRHLFLSEDRPAIIRVASRAVTRATNNYAL